MKHPKIEERQIKTKEGFLEFQFVAHCQNDRNKIATTIENFDPLVAALKVLVLSPSTEAWLKANDPKALHQAIAALRSALGGARSLADRALDLESRSLA